MPQKNFDKWVFSTLGVILLFTGLRLNWPDHWSYWGPIDAKVLSLARDLISSKTEVFMASFSSREIFSVFFLKQIIKLSDDPLHLGRFILIAASLFTLVLWYYALKKLLGSLAAFVGFITIAISPNMLSTIDSVSSHSFTNLFLTLFPSTILFLSPRDLTSGFVKHVLLPLIIFMVAISSFNAPEIGIFYLTFITLYLRQESGFRWKVVIACVAGTLLFLRYYHPSATELSHLAISGRNIKISYLTDWLMFFAPLTFLFGIAAVGIPIRKRKICDRNHVWKFHSSEEARRFGIALGCAALAYDGLGRMVQNESFVFPLHLYPTFSFIVAFCVRELLGELESLLKKSRPAWGMLVGWLTPILAIVIVLVPAWIYLSQYPNAIFQASLLGHPQGMPKETYFAMEKAAHFMVQDSAPEDLWFVPETFGWSDTEAHPFLRVWSNRRALGDGKHLSFFLKRVALLREEINRRKLPGRILVLSNSHATGTDIRDYLRKNGNLLEDHSTEYGTMEVFGISVPSGPEQLG